MGNKINHRVVLGKAGKKINSYGIAIVASLVLILVFGVTLTSGASQNHKQNQVKISDLEFRLNQLEDRLSETEAQKNDTKNQLNKKIDEVSKLKKGLEKIVRESKEQNNLVFSNAFLNNLEPVENSKKEKSPAQIAKTQKKKKYYTHLNIAGFASYDVEYVLGQTALTQLEEAAKKHNFEIKYTTYDFGAFVECIGGVCGDSSHFWALYKNGEMSMVGASDLVLKIDDQISWVYTNF